nr:MAG TPA: DNA pilot protein VP2 [Microviridae sp.]
MPIDPGTATLATGGLSLVSGLFGSGMSNKSVKRSIKAAKEINQINNEFNASEALKNRDFQTSEREASQQWNLDQWNRENAYNDPSAQRARMEAAGFNPYNMNIDAGSASTSGAQSSPGSGSPASASHVPSLPAYTGYTADFQNIASGIAQIGSAISSGIDARLTSAYGDDLMKADIMSKIGGNSEWLTDVYKLGRQNEAPNLLGIDLRKKRLENLSTETNIKVALAQGALLGLQAKGQRIVNKFMPAQQQAEFFLKTANVFAQYKAGKLSEAQVKTQIKQQALLEAQSVGQKLNNRLAERLADYQFKAMAAEYRANAAYYNGFYNDAWQAGMSKATLARYESNAARIAAHMSEIFKDREKSSWKNNPIYYNIEEFLKGILGSVGSVAGPLYLGSKVGSFKKVGKAAGG